MRRSLQKKKETANLTIRFILKDTPAPGPLTIKFSVINPEGEDVTGTFHLSADDMNTITKGKGIEAAFATWDYT